MRSASSFLIAAAFLCGCQRAPEAASANAALPASGAIPASCMWDLPGDPVAAARADAAKGQVQLYAYWQNGEATHLVTPGVYNCPGPAPPRDGMHVRLVELRISIDEAATRELMAHTADMPEVLDACGRRQDAYMRRYNLEMVRLRPPAIRSQCRGMMVYAEPDGG